MLWRAPGKGLEKFKSEWSGGGGVLSMNNALSRRPSACSRWTIISPTHSLSL